MELLWTYNPLGWCIVACLEYGPPLCEDWGHTADNFVRNCNTRTLWELEPADTETFTMINRVIICQVGKLGNLQKVMDTNINPVSDSKTSNLSADPNICLPLRYPKHERKNGNYQYDIWIWLCYRLVLQVLLQNMWNTLIQKYYQGRIVWFYYLPQNQKWNW